MVIMSDTFSVFLGNFNCYLIWYVLVHVCMPAIRAERSKGDDEQMRCNTKRQSLRMRLSQSSFRLLVLSILCFSVLIFMYCWEHRWESKRKSQLKDIAKYISHTWSHNQQPWKSKFKNISNVYLEWIWWESN